MTNSTGVKQFESDYYPQGSQRVITATKDSLLKFQAKQLDTESGLENAARLYNPATARFLSVAAKPAKKTPTPQALNKVSAPAATPLSTLISSVGSILGAFRSALSSYRQCAQTAMDFGGSDFASGGPARSWVEILCGLPDPGPSGFDSAPSVFTCTCEGGASTGFLLSRCGAVCTCTDNIEKQFVTSFSRLGDVLPLCRSFKCPKSFEATKTSQQIEILGFGFTIDHITITPGTCLF
jgi:hypothetical protein